MKKLISLALFLALITGMCCTSPLLAAAETYTAATAFDWNGHTYHFYDQKMTWKDAKEYCLNSGGHLVTINSQQEWDVIHDRIVDNGKHYWLGAHINPNTDFYEWRWVTDEPWSLTFWGSGEPADKGNYVGTYTDTYMWHNYNSTAQLGFICEFDDENYIANLEYGGRQNAFFSLLPFTLSFTNIHPDYVYRISIYPSSEIVRLNHIDDQPIISNDLITGRKYEVPANTIPAYSSTYAYYKVIVGTYKNHSLDSLIEEREDYITTHPVFKIRSPYNIQTLYDASDLTVKFRIEPEYESILDELDFYLKVYDAETEEVIFDNIVYEPTIDLSGYPFKPGHDYRIAARVAPNSKYNIYEEFGDDIIIACISPKFTNNAYAKPSTDNVTLNGLEISPSKPAGYKVGDRNYYKLRDIAMALNSFEVKWENNAIYIETGKSYTPVGGELTPISAGETRTIATPYPNEIYIDGAPVKLNAYTINNNTYFQIRDLANHLDFGVDYDSKTTTVLLSSASLIFPLKGKIVRSSSLKTKGIYCDYKTGGSVGVYAPANGTVVYKQAYKNESDGKMLSSYGNYIEFTSSDGVYKIKCCHLSSFNGVDTDIKKSLSYPCSGSHGTITLKTSTKTSDVKQGDLLGYSGMTGNASGHHLHLEVYKNGIAVDPTSVFKEW